MSTTHDDATTWRDLADQLTAEERAGIERIEAEGGVPPNALLQWARDYVDYHVADIAYGGVPVPSGAHTDVSGWGKDQDGIYSRSLLWRSYEGPGDVSIDIDGRQESGGAFTRHISLWGAEDGGQLSSAGAREIAALLIQAADELDRLGR